MKYGRPFVHWLALTALYTAFAALMLVIGTYIQASRLALNLHGLAIAVAFGSVIGTLRYRRDRELTVRHSIFPWVLCFVAVAVVSWAYFLRSNSPSHALGRAELAVFVAAWCACLATFIPRRWLFTTFGRSRFAPNNSIQRTR